MRHQLAIVPAAALTLWVLPGCTELETFTLGIDAPPTFNDQIRLDRSREGLTPNQRNVDISLGAYRDGWDADGSETEVVSELYPHFDGASQRSVERRLRRGSLLESSMRGDTRRRTR
jgi:hypothetical protein